MKKVCATLLAGFQLSQDRRGDTIIIESPRLQALLAYLLLHRQKPVSRQQLAYLLWPDSPETQARTNLRKLLYQLRREWPEVENFLSIEGQQLSWRVAVELDVAAFETAVAHAHATQQPEDYRQAISLYAGDLLPGHYDEWLLEIREQLYQQYLALLTQIIDLLETQRLYDEAIRYARQLLRQDPLHEAITRQLMRLHALNGNLAGALRAYHDCVTHLQQALQIPPSPETAALYHRLLQQDVAPAAQTTGAPQTIRLNYELIGRHAEWRALQQAWRRAAAGQTAVVLLSGEAGIGKTRLGEEMVRWAQRQGITALTAICYAAGSLPFGPVADWLREEDLAETLFQLEPRWRTEIARLLPELLIQQTDLPPPGPLTEAWQRQHLFTALAQAIFNATPLLLFIDDLQWCDADTLDWLNFLFRYRPDMPLLLLGAARSEDVPSDHPLTTWQRQVQRTVAFTEIPLARLDAAAAAELAAQVSGRTLETAVFQQLYTATEGNPLFLVEMVRALPSDAALPADQALPQKVQAAIETRLAQLSPAAQEILGVAALIGRSFTYTLLAAATDLPESRLIAALDELWQRGILRDLEQDAYTFSHDKIRQEAAQSLPPARRRHIRQRVLSALTTVYAGNLDPVYGQIAAHEEALGHSAQAITHYRQAAGVSRHLFAHRETAVHLRRALALATQPDANLNPESIAGLYAQQGDALTLLDERDQARNAFSAGIQRSADPVFQAQLWQKIGKTWLTSHDYSAADTAFRQAMACLALTSPDETERWWETWLDVQIMLIDLRYFQNKQHELEALCREIKAPVLAHGSPRQKADYYTALAMANHRKNRFVTTPENIDTYQQALVWAHKTGNLPYITHRTFGAGFVHLWAGERETAVTYLQTAVFRSEREGNQPLHNQSLAYLTIARRMQGDETAVADLLPAALELAAAAQNPLYLGSAHANQAWLAYRRNQPEQVAPLAHAALQTWADFAWPLRWLAAWPLLAAALWNDQPDEALYAARLMLEDSQQMLPQEITAALTAALESPPGIPHLEQALALARTQNYC